MMILKKINSLLILFIIIIYFNPAAFCQQEMPVCAFFPFKNKSGFNNKNWDIVNGIPDGFVDSLIKLGKHQIIELSKIDDYLRENKIRSYQYERPEILDRIADEINIDYLIVGQIDEFGLSRINVGNFLVGGYESYKAEIKISFFVYDHINKIKTENHTCSSEIKKRIWD